MKSDRHAISASFQSAAYTLVEVLIAMALVGIMVGGLYAGMTYGAQRVSQTREEMRATQILIEAMEQVRLYRWADMNSMVDPDDLVDDDPADPFDSDDPHVVEDEPDTVHIPTSFSVPFTPGNTNLAGLHYQGTISVTNAPVSEAYNDQLLLVTMQLTWQSGGRTHSRRAQTFFAKHGIQHNSFKR